MSRELVTQDACQDEACKLKGLLEAAWNEISSAPADELPADTIRRVLALIEIARDMTDDIAVALLEDFDQLAAEAAR